MNPIAEARALHARYAAGTPQAALAREWGRSQGWVANRLRLLRLPAPVQAYLEAGRLSVEWGETLLHWEAEPAECVRLADLAAAPGSTFRLGALQAQARAEGRVRRRHTGSLRRCARCFDAHPEASLHGHLCAGCRNGSTPAFTLPPMPVPREG